MSEVILTAPATEMSTHRDREFLGFGTCAPPTVIPPWLLKMFFYPKVSNRKGVAKYAPYGLRKVESVLIENGLNPVTVHPYYIRKFLKDAKVVGISVMDPLGLGPVSVTLSSLLGGVPTTRIEFLKIMEDIERERAKKGLKVIVGGPGSWQIEVEKEFKNHIDCVVVGEAEEVVGDIFRDAVEGKDLPEVVYCKSPELDKIPIIKNPSVNGLVEISRGCSRKCRFCTTTMYRKQDIPLKIILEEARINVKGGTKGVILHAEDVLMYGCKDPKFIPDKEKVIGLFREVKKITDNIGISHCSLAAVACKPEIVEEISAMLEVGDSRPYFGIQTGIETGSPALLSEYMKQKTLPYSPSEWPDVVEQAFGIMHDYNWVPAATLLLGLPKETKDDVLKTIELMDRLKGYRSLIAPLFFVPMISYLRKAQAFTIEHMTDEHWELIKACVNHGLRHIDSLLEGYLNNTPIKILYWLFARWVKKRWQEVQEVYPLGRR